MGWGGGGPPADDDRGCYDPVLPRLTPFGPVSMLILMLPFRCYQPPNYLPLHDTILTIKRKINYKLPCVNGQRVINQV